MYLVNTWLGIVFSSASGMFVIYYFVIAYCFTDRKSAKKKNQSWFTIHDDPSLMGPKPYLFKNHRRNHKIHWLSCHSNNLQRLDAENLHTYSFHPRRPAFHSNRPVHSDLRYSNICWIDSIIKLKLKWSWWYWFNSLKVGKSGWV